MPLQHFAGNFSITPLIRLDEPDTVEQQKENIAEDNCQLVGGNSVQK